METSAAFFTSIHIESVFRGLIEYGKLVELERWISIDWNMEN